MASSGYDVVVDVDDEVCATSRYRANMLGAQNGSFRLTTL